VDVLLDSTRPARKSGRKGKPLAGTVLALALLAALSLPASAAAGQTVTVTAPSPQAQQVSSAQASRIADREPKVLAERRENPGMTSSASLVDGNWEVAYFAHDDEVALVLVDPATGLVRESWTGYQVAWKMARGYSGAFGHKLNAPYVFIPLCLLFLAGLVDWRRPWRVANLDLLVLLGFAVSHFFFNRAQIGVSVPLAYPPMLYLAARMLWVGWRGRGEGLRPVWPARWLLVAALFLVGFRVGLNLADSGVIDVGYAGVVGADRVADGTQLYDNFPDDVSEGDTYGPVNYYAYVPFEQAFPWSGSWDDLPAGHAAAVFFDLGAFALLLLLGHRMRRGPPGRMLAATLGFAWAAYPYTAYTLESNSNDTLVAVLLIATLVVAARPAARGALLALATFTKFAPIALAPMLATYNAGDESDSHGAAAATEEADLDARDRTRGPGVWWAQFRDRTRGPGVFILAFVGVSLLVMLQTILDPGIATFWDRTLGYQAGRDSPFSIWGQAPSLEPLRTAIIAATGLLALALSFVPRRKSLVQVAALGATLMLAVELTAEHWFYLYIVWFLPLVLVALAGLSPRPEPGSARSTPPGRRAEPRPGPPSPRRPPRRSRSEPASA
jgi:hypothetical protein